MYGSIGNLPVVTALKKMALFVSVIINNINPSGGIEASRASLPFMIDHL